MTDNTISLPLSFEPIDTIATSQEAIQLAQYWVSVYKVLKKSQATQMEQQSEREPNDKLDKLNHQINQIREYVDQLNEKEKECRSEEKRQHKDKQRLVKQADEALYQERLDHFQPIKADHNAYLQRYTNEENAVKQNIANIKEQYERSLSPFKKRLMTMEMEKDEVQRSYEKCCPHHFGKRYRSSVRNRRKPCSVCNSVDDDEDYAY